MPDLSAERDAAMRAVLERLGREAYRHYARTAGESWAGSRFERGELDDAMASLRALLAAGEAKPVRCHTYGCDQPAVHEIPLYCEPHLLESRAARQQEIARHADSARAEAYERGFREGKQSASRPHDWLDLIEGMVDRADEGFTLPATEDDWLVTRHTHTGAEIKIRHGVLYMSTDGGVRVSAVMRLIAYMVSRKRRRIPPDWVTCQCGHHKREHRDGVGECIEYVCPCREFLCQWPAAPRPVPPAAARLSDELEGRADALIAISAGNVSAGVTDQLLRLSRKLRECAEPLRPAPAEAGPPPVSEAERQALEEMAREGKRADAELDVIETLWGLSGRGADLDNQEPPGVKVPQPTPSRASVRILRNSDEPCNIIGLHPLMWRDLPCAPEFFLSDPCWLPRARSQRPQSGSTCTFRSWPPLPGVTRNE